MGEGHGSSRTFAQKGWAPGGSGCSFRPKHPVEARADKLHANNSLAIAYYKQSRGVPPEEAQKDQLDSMMCAMESKFALMKGVLMPGGNCSVFKRIEAQSPSKPAE